MSSTATILIVDDEPLIREVLICDLTDRGYATLEAEDGEGALRVLRSKPVSVVISDLSMPSLEGLALLSQMRVEELWQPFIILTGYGSKDASITALRLGAFDFLEKPADFDRLAEIVAQAVAFHDAHREMLTVLENRLGGDPSPANQRKIDSLARMFAARSAASLPKK